MSSAVWIAPARHDVRGSRPCGVMRNRADRSAIAYIDTSPIGPGPVSGEGGIDIDPRGRGVRSFRGLPMNDSIGVVAITSGHSAG